MTSMPNTSETLQGYTSPSIMSGSWDPILNELKKTTVKRTNLVWGLFVSECSYKLETYEPLFGIEWEVENFTKSGLIETIGRAGPWGHVVDNSLRHNGLELVFQGGQNYRISVDAMRNTYPILYENGIQFSHRTSIHVHNCVFMKTKEELAKYVFLYYLVEPYLFEFVRRNRQYNNFCVPLRALEPTRISGVNLSKIPKYAALGAFRLSGLGTLEWRHLPGNASLDTILKWLEMINNLDRYTFRTDPEDPIYTLSQAIRYWWRNPENLQEVIRNIFGFDLSSEYLKEQILKFHSFSLGEFL